MQQAGIEKSVMEQIHSIAHDAHSAIENVCSGNHPGGGGPHEGHEGMGGGCGEMPHNARPGNSPNGGQGSGTGNPPPSSQSSPQN